MSDSNKKSVRQLDPTSADYKECLECLVELEEKPESEPFFIPVDCKGSNLLEYPEVVKKPMDLATIRTRLENRQYANVDAFGADVRLVWANALECNEPGSGIYDAALSLSQVFEERFAKVCESSEKTRFIQLLNQMRSSQIGEVVAMLQDRCPSAVTSDDESFLEIHVENIDKATLRALIAFAERCRVCNEGS
eukprot:TRINITY_DN2518_c0_g1_i1.p1 TRINITY_DN2518_c0_g1~~TRINITY_DN2518_c0_g1_i1.p1  ORF type:complete len:193 (-),score=41.32 TRINITY_DN2518_c0_g1_i1:552-1130(-)